MSVNAQSGSILQQRLRQYLDESEKQGLSGSVLIAQNGRVLFEGAYGYANRKKKIENKVSTHFSLASMGKLFTMVAVMKLVEEGRLSMDDKLSGFVKGFSDKRAGDITIFQLLSHRSGWQHYWDHPDYLANRDSFDSIADYMGVIKTLPLSFDPGSQEQYSNIGFIVLGAVIEKVSGKDYYTFMDEYLFTPLGMEDTDYPEFRNLPPNYALLGGGDEFPLNTAAARGASDGGGYSTVQDIYRIFNALVHDNYLNEQHLTYITTLFRASERSENWRVRIAGGFPGVNTTACYQAKDGLLVIVLTNNDPPLAMDMAEKLFEITREQ